MAKDEWSVLEEQVAEAWIRRHARRSAVGRCVTKCCPTCCSCCFRRKSVASSYFRTIAIGIIFFAILVAFLTWLIVPYMRSIGFKPTICHVVSKEENTAMVSCTCGKACFGKYPCLKIRVSYSKGGAGSGRAMLHATEYRDTHECTFTPPCRRDYETNARAVREFSSSYSSSFDCLYDSNSDYVMAFRRISTHGAFHIIFWPSLAVFVCVVILLLMLATCGTRFICTTKKPPQDIARLAAGLEQMGKTELDDVDHDHELDVLIKRSCFAQKAIA